MIRRGASWLAAGVIGLAGCSGWYSRPALLGQPQPIERQVRVCVARQCRQVHAIRVTGDSLTAVPAYESADCDSCTLRYAVRDVDSVQAHESNPVATGFLVAVLAAVVVGMIRFISLVRGLGDS